MAYTKRITPQIRHPRNPLAPAPASRPRDRVSTSPSLFGKPKAEAPRYRDPVDPGWGDTSDVPGTDWSRMGILRIASLMCHYFVYILWLLCGFLVASLCLRSHAQAGPSPGREPRTGLASTESRRLKSGRLPGYRNNPSGAGGC